jgi:peptidyl-tRNA hydrolase, PTH1 family
MKHLLIAGLGNPGSKYEKTRHNIGFIILDSWLEDHSLTWGTDKNSVYAKYSQDEFTIHLVKPQEYMNLSGKEVARISKLYKIPPANILIVHDEIDIPFGKIKNKVGGGTAGHNGLGDIVERLGDKGFHRLRFGVGKPAHPDFAVADYVLQKFSSEEFDELPKLIKESKQRIHDWIKMRMVELKE